jgi:hypothetical protein
MLSQSLLKYISRSKCVLIYLQLAPNPNNIDFSASFPTSSRLDNLDLFENLLALLNILITTLTFPPLIPTNPTLINLAAKSIRLYSNSNIQRTPSKLQNHLNINQYHSSHIYPRLHPCSSIPCAISDNTTSASTPIPCTRS